MDNISVKLIHITPPTAVVNAIANPYNTDKFRKDDVGAMKAIRNICLNEDGTERHGSVLEHIVTQWEIIGSSRLELQEHMRHRIASPTVKSTRYTLKEFLNDDNYVIKDYFVRPPRSEFESDEDYTLFISNQIRLAVYFKETLIELQNSLKLAKHSRFQDIAKYLIPEGFRTRFTWTINMRSLLNFIRLRLDKNAHFEIRYIAKLIQDALMETEYQYLLK